MTSHLVVILSYLGRIVKIISIKSFLTDASDVLVCDEDVLFSYSGKTTSAASHKKWRNPNFFGYFQNPEKAAKNRSGENIGETEMWSRKYRTFYP
jgi:hypothetical protein